MLICINKKIVFKDKASKLVQIIKINFNKIINFNNQIMLINKINFNNQITLTNKTNFNKINSNSKIILINTINFNKIR